MFKTVDRRIRKKEKSKNLEEETEEMLGFNSADTDSDDTIDEEGEEESEVVSPESKDEDEEDQALAPINPLRNVFLEPEVKACAVCPGKFLKNPVMIDVHMKLGTHKRRLQSLGERHVDPETDVRDLVRAPRLASQPEKPVEGQLLKRAEKKKAKLAAIKAKHQKRKHEGEV
ncbi:hypothetical protein LXA43DRAFT_1060185 [Ganoderma leucocontextum]|nr:hypothetical protein LXA43DRAFT_1060185 [Ganoderma leucocontextum]